MEDRLKSKRDRALIATRVSIVLALLVGLATSTSAQHRTLEPTFPNAERLLPADATKDDGEPQLYVLDTRTGDILATGLYDGALKRVATLPGPPALLGAELAASFETGKLLVLAPERGELIRVDLTVAPPTFQTQKVSPGSRALRPDAVGKRFVYLDHGAKELRLMVLTTSNGGVAEVISRAPLPAQALPAMTAIHPAGHRALLTLPFDSALAFLDEDGETATLPSPVAFPVLATFGAAETDEVYLMGQQARVARLGGDGAVLAESPPVPFSTHLSYCEALDALVLVELIKPEVPLSRLHLLDGQTLERANGDDVELPMLSGAVLSAAVHERDLVVLLRGDGTTQLVIVDLLTGALITDSKTETSLATSLAIR